MVSYSRDCDTNPGMLTTVTLSHRIIRYHIYPNGQAGLSNVDPDLQKEQFDQCLDCFHSFTTLPSIQMILFKFYEKYSSSKELIMQNI